MPSGAEHRERAYVAASRRTDRPNEARLASAIKASQAHYERTGRRFKITMEIVLGDEMYREEEEPRPRHSSSYAGATFSDRPHLGRKRSQDDCQEPFEVRERRVNQMFDLAFPWHRQHCLLQQNQRREREKREDREDREWDARDSRADSMVSGTSGTSGTSGMSGMSGTSGTSAPSMTLSGGKPPTPALSPAPHTPGTIATPAATPAMGYDTVIPSLVSPDASMALNNGMAVGQNYAPVFPGPEDPVYLLQPATTTPRKSGTAPPPLAESLLVSTATTKAPHSPCLWTPPDDEPTSAENYAFSRQAFLPQMASGLDGTLSDHMVAVDENGNYFLSLEGHGDYDTSSSCSNMIMRSFNPSMLSMDGGDLDDTGLFASTDPADTMLGDPAGMLYSFTGKSASPTSASDRDYMFAASMAAFPSFSADH